MIRGAGRLGCGCVGALLLIGLLALALESFSTGQGGTGVLLLVVLGLLVILGRRRDKPKPAPPVVSVGTRVRLPESARQRVFREDGRTCWYCGRREGRGVALVIDHIHPVAHGGTNERRNLRTACAACNAAKSDHVWDEKGLNAFREHRRRLAREREPRRLRW